MIDIQIQITGYKGLMKGLGMAPMLMSKGIYSALDKSLYAVERESKLRTPVGSGRLRTSIGSKGSQGWRWIKGNVASMGTKVHYASYVEEGTGIYGPMKRRIFPKTKKALYWSGAPHPFKSVRGQRPRRFMAEGVEASLPAIEKYFDEAIGKVTIQIVNQSD